MLSNKIIQVEGINVSVVKYSYGSFLYPEFNGDAEFKLTKRDFKSLRHYLRTWKWIQKISNNGSNNV